MDCKRVILAFFYYYLRKEYLILSHCKKISSVLFLEAGETLMVLIQIQN